MPTPDSVPSFRNERAQPENPAPFPRVGEWLWACRAGAEVDLCEELASLRVPGRAIEPGLVASEKRPQAELVFGRQGLPVQKLYEVAPLQTAAATGQAIAKAIAAPLSRELRRSFALHVFTADSEAGSRLYPLAAALEPALAAALAGEGRPRQLADGTAAHAEGGQLLQVCLLERSSKSGAGPKTVVVVAGVLPATAAPSLFPGGVQRVRRPREAPSRSAHKLAEALAWLGHGPEAGDQCVDLGAAPGGWSYVLAERRCQVMAVDLAALSPSVLRRVRHERRNAFDFVPDEPVDWVLCDMAYRPLEVAALLARWGRHRWARFLLANIKLPMKKRVEMLGRVKEILATGGWTGLRARQLYHDRDEVTIFAWRGFGMDARPGRPGQRPEPQKRPLEKRAPAPRKPGPRQPPARRQASGGGAGGSAGASSRVRRRSRK